MRKLRRLTPAAIFLFGLVFLPEVSGAQPVDFSKAVLRGPVSDESIYFVMTDRYANGDTSNDSAGLTGGPLESGFNPSEIGWWHGGDFKGLTENLTRIKDLGFTSIWITPPVKQQYVQFQSAAYHGYWGVDFTTVDPHLGTEADFKDFVSASHKLGLKVIIDVVANHTADVIRYEDGSHNYRDIARYPYRDAKKRPFIPELVAGKSTFPKLSVNYSFPHKPVVDAAKKNIKNPAWLNDLTNYHNRGNSTFSGTSIGDGDFYGLDDLFTEKPEVVAGWIEVWSGWITKFDIDGLRIDTLRHVNPEFWKAVIPKVLAVARSAGKPDFPIFGEVTVSDADVLSEYVLSGQTPSILDFTFQRFMAAYTQGYLPASGLPAFFNTDDYYTSAKTSAYDLVTFLGNHDMGRIGMIINSSSETAGQKLQRAELANALLFLLRGAPVIYYGDEKGMTGTGGDKAARQDMFATAVDYWKHAVRIGGTPIGDRSSFDVINPLEVQITELAQIVAANPALRNGVQQIISADANIFAVSRYKGSQEYVVAFNSTESSQKAIFQVSTAESQWSKLTGSGSFASLKSQLSVEIPARSYLVLKAERQFRPSNKVSVSLGKPVLDIYTNGWYAVPAKVPGNEFVEVTFAARYLGKPWKILGTSDRRTFTSPTTAGGLHRVYLRPKEFKKGSVLELQAIAKNQKGVIAWSNIVKVTLPK